MSPHRHQASAEGGDRCRRGDQLCHRLDRLTGYHTLAARTPSGRRGRSASASERRRSADCRAPSPPRGASTPARLSTLQCGSSCCRAGGRTAGAARGPYLTGFDRAAAHGLQVGSGQSGVTAPKDLAPDDPGRWERTAPPASTCPGAPCRADQDRVATGPRRANPAASLEPAPGLGAGPWRFGWLSAAFRLTMDRPGSSRTPWWAARSGLKSVPRQYHRRHRYRQHLFSDQTVDSKGCRCAGNDARVSMIIL
jgi:hypothetical protein